MTPFPHDIFTEPADVDPDTLANLGPLARLAGRWEASKGIDINPKAKSSKLAVHTSSHSYDPDADSALLHHGSARDTAQ